MVDLQGIHWEQRSQLCSVVCNLQSQHILQLMCGLTQIYFNGKFSLHLNLHTVASYILVSTQLMSKGIHILY